MTWSITIDQQASISRACQSYGPTIKNGCLSAAIALAVIEFGLHDVQLGSYQITAVPA